MFEKHNYNNVFIETGSYAGDGIRNAIFAGYKKIYSVELTDRYYQYCKNYFKYNDNVVLLQGDSVALLPSILDKLDEPATFWLDAHYSGGETSFNNILSPLMQELEIISKHSIKSHTIIIDDLREWKEEYPAIGFGTDDLKSKILEINKDYVFSFVDGHVAGDILVAEIKRIRPINIIVFSKDRAMQLELFLRSFKNLVKDSDRYLVHVLYTFSDNEYKMGYDVLIPLYPNVDFRLEKDFKQDVIDLVNPKNKYTVFFVDDNVFKEHFCFYDRQMDVFNENGSILCRSLRLSRTLSYCYPTRKVMAQPRFDGDGAFSWKTAQGDYGYPMSVDGHIYKTGTILEYIHDDYGNPNTFEGKMAARGSNIPKMMCYQKSVIVNNPINKVQTVNSNLHGNVGAKQLNDAFLNGFAIQHEPFIGLENMSCHQEIPIQFIKR